MKSIIGLSAILLLLNSIALAQTINTITVRAGDSIKNALSFTDKYQYPAFTDGQVYYKDGSVSRGKLDYNFLFDEMHFISRNGDTLAVTNEPLIKYVVIQKDSFYYDKGFLHLIASNGMAKLAKKTLLKELDKQKIGGYDMRSSTSAITNYQSFTADNAVYNLHVREDILLAKKASYFFSNRNNEFLAANRKNVLKLFPKNQKEIAAYLKDNGVDFAKEDDLKRLMSFLQTLQ